MRATKPMSSTKPVSVAPEGGKQKLHAVCGEDHRVKGLPEVDRREDCPHVPWRMPARHQTYHIRRAIDLWGFVEKPDLHLKAFPKLGGEGGDV
ncbi:hypothetical protein BV898_08831 [Hypsibius exemplaris]|uniref:Uncharacterized protein n=1 Tax=Hypsibius exemplaris TaxID=2072580 RepID=A0A1W0WPI8_HYPEX|nr:hypothetical protein BV898_08831 [Hypsibius exemplaris]